MLLPQKHVEGRCVRVAGEKCGEGCCVRVPGKDVIHDYYYRRGAADVIPVGTFNVRVAPDPVIVIPPPAAVNVVIPEPPPPEPMRVRRS